MGSLQEGIYHNCSNCTGPHFTVLLLRAVDGATAPRIGGLLGRLWSVYQNLKNGVVVDLPGQRVPSGELRVLVGYGRNVFTRPCVGRRAPPELLRYGFASPKAGSKDPVPIMPNSGIRYDEDVFDNPAEADIAVQFTARTQIAVHRPIVETWKCLRDLQQDPVERERAAAEQAPVVPLEMAGFFSGHQRDDRRSWIDFHDGVNNLRREERQAAISIKPNADAGWATGGTYMAFIRIAVNLTAWRALSRTEQEHIVGRDKLTGAPLVRDGQGKGRPAPGCPVSGTSDVLQGGNEPFREQRFPELLPDSHVQRANNHRRQAPEFRASSRIYRQGFEFLEPLDTAPFFRAGLNFVSFQDSPERLHTILTQDRWLGGRNFGGDPKPTRGGSWLLTARAAGMFLVPPVVKDERFPGHSILGY
jgi:deferrochelatase/peroxidase EfeB